MIIKVEIVGDRAFLTSKPGSAGGIAAMEIPAEYVRRRFHGQEKEQVLVGFFLATQEPRVVLAADGTAVETVPDSSGVLELGERVLQGEWW